MKKAIRACAALLLFAGMGLLDRSFARWRNDPRSFPNANGTYLTSSDISADQRPQVSDPQTRKLMALFGGGLFLSSVVLFTVVPFEPADLQGQST